MQNFDEIYKRYGEVVYKYLLSITRNKEIAEELMQETLCKALAKIEDFRGECKINFWLCKIARNEFFMYRNKHHKFEDIPIDEVMIIAPDASIEETVIDNDIKNRIYNEIKKLDKETAEIMILRLEEEMTFKQIGEIFNKNETWARVKFFRGKQKLQERLQNSDMKEMIEHNGN